MNKLKKLKGLAHMCWPAAHCTGIDYSDEKPSALFVLAACCFLKCTVQHVFGIFCWFEFNVYRYCIEYMQPGLSSPHSPSHSPSLHWVFNSQQYMFTAWQLTWSPASTSLKSSWFFSSLLPECFFCKMKHHAV